MAPHGDEIHAAADNMASMAGMDGMDGMSSSTMNMGMSMVFQNSINTPVYTSMWTPTNVGQYVGTIIFLVVLTILLRCLLAVKTWQEARWLERELNRRYIVVNGKQTLGQRLSTDSLGKQMTLSENGLEENVMVVQKRTSHVRPWRLSVDPVRAVLDTIIAGVGYLLMLAVMTMNVGYFLAVLGGTFLGSVLVGRFTVFENH